MTHDAGLQEDFADAMRRRRRNMVARLGIVTAGVLVFLPVTGPVIGLTWLSAYFLMQMIEARLSVPVTAPGNRVLGAWRRTAVCGSIFLSSLIYASFTLHLWSMGGLAGGVCAVLILAGGMMNALAVAGRSRLMLSLNLAPYFLLLAPVAPLLLTGGASRAFAVGAGAVCAMLTAYTIVVYGDVLRLAWSEHRARQEGDRRRKEAEAAIQGKSAFVAAVSHDLRTPLSAILTGAHDLEAAAGDSASRETAALIGEAGRLMKTLLDQLLDQAKLEAGRMEVQTRAFNLRHVLARTLRLWQREAAEQGLRLRLEGAAQAPDWVLGDPTRIRQVLNNLISNALKFTQDGTVTVRIRAWDQDETVALTLEVIDTGPGMDAAQLARLFTPFDQTDGGVTARHGGTGLGLSISRDLAQLMGGWLTARSVRGEGAAFTLALNLPRTAAPDAPIVEAPEARDRIPHSRPLAPRRRPADPPPVPDEAPAQAEPAGLDGNETPSSAGPEPAQDTEPAERPLRVLVVDDHEINRRAVQLILSPLGVEIASAADGIAALAAAEVQAYDVIFMDVRMPELDGRETTRRLRAGDGPNRATPIIAVTADTAQDDIDACMAAGMDYFVSKPLTPASLLGALNHVMVEAGLTRERAA